MDHFLFYENIWNLLNITYLSTIFYSLTAHDVHRQREGGVWTSLRCPFNSSRYIAALGNDHIERHRYICYTHGPTPIWFIKLSWAIEVYSTWPLNKQVELRLGLIQIVCSSRFHLKLMTISRNIYVFLSWSALHNEEIIPYPKNKKTFITSKILYIIEFRNLQRIQDGKF